MAFLAAARRASGTSSIETAFLVRPGGRSASPQPATTLAAEHATTDARRSRRLSKSGRLTALREDPGRTGVGSIVIGDDFSPSAGTQGLVDLIAYLVAQVADVAVAVKEKRTAAMTAEELIDVAARVTWAVA